jgi:iron(III) transport system permease protein
VLVAAALLPLAFPILELLSSLGALGHACTALSRPRLWQLLLRSLGLAAAVTSATLALGLPLGFVLGRSDAAGRRAAFVLHAFPVFLPPFLSALGWFQIAGSGGWLGSDLGSRLLFSDLGVVLVLALAFTPVVSSLSALALRGVDPSLEEAARLVAGPWRVAWRILLPTAWPAALLGALIVFTLAFSELAVPSFLRRDVYPAAVFSRLAGASFAPGEAFALVVPLFPLAAAFIVFERRILGRRGFAVLGLRAREQAPLPLGRARLAVSVAAWVLALLSAAPLGALGLVALVRGGFAQLSGDAFSSAATSLLVAVAAASVTTALALVLGHALARRRRAAGTVDLAAVAAFFTPAPVLGVGLIALWNRPGLEAVYGSIAILAVAHVARYAALGVRTAAAAFAQSSPHLEESAAAAGAGYLRRLARIIVPVHWRGLAGAFILVLVFSLRDLETTVLFYPPGTQPLSVRIFTLEANGPPPLVAALCALQVLVTAAPVALGAWLIARGGRA